MLTVPKGVWATCDIADFDLERDRPIVWLWGNREVILSKPEQTEYNTLS